MSKSLNQAFIRAYSKEQAQLAKQREQGSNIGLNADDFIVRFDTATCAVPNMHTQSSKALNSTSSSNAPNSLARAALPESKQQPTEFYSELPKSAERPRTATNSLAAKVSATDVRRSGSTAKTSFEAEAELQVAEELRQEIAARMSRAGAWDAQQIDAFIGGFPMISAYHQPSRSSQPGSPSERRPRVTNHQDLKGPHFNRGETRQAVLAANRSDDRSAIRHAQRSEPIEIDRTAPVRHVSLVDSEAVVPQAPAVRSQQQTSQHSELTDPQPTQGISPAPSPALTPLEFPALANGALDTQSTRTAQMSRATRIQELGGSGDIFRLDRPTYSQPNDYLLVEHGFDSGELSSEILEYSASGTKVDIEGMGSAGPVVGQQTQTAQSTLPTSEARVGFAEAHAVAEQDQATISNTEAAEVPTATSRAKSLENDLRKAKVRIFNPVWEVDSFQWPDICLELLQQRAETMELVARNLSEACQEGLQVLAITSPRSGEGRTTVACCLAKLAGSRGLNVAIVDGDIENPTLSYQTNLEVEQDWKTAILNQLPLEEVAVHSIDDQVTLVPLVAPIDRHEMSTNDNRIELMLQELSESFDLVIVDMGHMESSRSLVTSLSERGVISAVVAVVDRRSSNRIQVEDCLRRLRQTGVASIGLVENFAA